MRTLSFVPLALLAGAAAAAEPTSVYTSTVAKDCARLASGEASGTWRCKGVAGIAVLIEEGDLRFSVSYGSRASDQPAARQGFSPLQSIGEKIEWRLGEGGKPFATILRWRMGFDSPADRREILVVTRLPPGKVCWVALIDARANKDPNALARQVADEKAKTFDCDATPAFVGDRTPGIEGLVNR
jgi:hypothetical protein